MSIGELIGFMLFVIVILGFCLHPSVYDRTVRRLGRFPRIVSHSDYMALRRQLPSEQRARARAVKQHRLLSAAHMRERGFHRAKVRECEELKAMLPARRLAAWKKSKIPIEPTVLQGFSDDDVAWLRKLATKGSQ